MMIKVLAVLAMLMVSVPVFAQAITSGTDFLGVPTSNVMPAKDIALTVYSFGPNMMGADDNHDAYGITAGVGNGLEINVNGSLDHTSMENTVVGLKFNFEQAAEDNGWVSPALFLYGLGEGRTGIPGLAVTYVQPDSRFSFSGAGWYADGEWECGAGAGFVLTENIRLVSEYSTDCGAFGGVELSYEWLVGRILKAEEDDWFMEAGVRLPIW